MDKIKSSHLIQKTDVLNNIKNDFDSLPIHLNYGSNYESNLY